ncbi:hypothetical protein OO013_15800 [Mangrovivirga sp. M17]|uniref:Uncharacterized protein n=1 Tax=Mangrovivirga halotolerans TaxID=2993936 RepID=A0ABT3RVS9_9BACT|nr:hypothetical protein [Mangrovivirga halotolerans]MCX2745342.1 hypothetical protein [Mangrovivirga halotolerans]
MNAEHTNLKSQLKKNTKRLSIWTFAWVITVALVSFGAKFLWDFNEAISIAAIILNLITGIGLILANRRYIMDLDELQRKIFMDAMAMALGVAVVGGLAYSMMDITNVIKGDAEISIVVMMIGITYMVSIIIGNFRYK